MVLSRGESALSLRLLAVAGHSHRLQRRDQGMSGMVLSLAMACVLAPPVETSAETTTHLYIRTTPPGAEVSMGGKKLGKSPGVFPVESGTQRIVIELDGHKAEEKDLSIRAGRVTRLELTLEKESLSLVNKLFFAILLRNARLDHEKQETIVKDSDLDWTIIRPSGLTDGPRTDTYALGENIRPKTSQISRADVAHAIIEEVQDNSFVHKAVTITN